MEISEEFIKKIANEIKNKRDVLEIREEIIGFKKRGMSKIEMLSVLEKMRNDNNDYYEDILLELMDFVDGFCRSDLSVF